MPGKAASTCHSRSRTARPVAAETRTGSTASRTARHRAALSLAWPIDAVPRANGARTSSSVTAGGASTRRDSCRASAAPAAAQAISST